MNISDLKMFEAVSRQGSMNQAARELNTVQSNVTARIRTLEEELGISLFHRHARGVSITAAGQRILPLVGQLSKLLADIKATARDDGTPAGTLRLGSLETTTALRLSPLLGRYTKRYPKVRFVLNTGTTQKLLEDVLNYKVEGAFVAGPINHPDITGKVIFREEMALITSTDIAAPSDLAGLPDLKTIVFQLGCSYRQKLEAVLARNGIATAKPLVFGSLDAILSCVSAGVGVSLLPKSLVKGPARKGQIALHPLPKEEAMVDTLFIQRSDVYISSALAAFLEMTYDNAGSKAKKPLAATSM
ncbi:MAG: LysR family transcriptional regulator [Alphaproteobacteria bacterium]|nr:MAG: LysR family transcriptional regulator [Alphaproteobacteria bacterium]